MWLTNVIYEDRVIEDERLELKDKDALYYLGPNFTLRRCTVVLRAPTRRLLLRGPRFIDCTIEVKTELKNLRWYDAYLKGCRFTGRLTGCDFGRWLDPTLAYAKIGGIEDCDFSGAYLHACRFSECDASTLRFPRWPCFTVLHPDRRKRELEAVEWPGLLRLAMCDFVERPETTAALTYSAKELARQLDTTEEAIRDVLETLDGVIY